MSTGSWNIFGVNIPELPGNIINDNPNNSAGNQLINLVGDAVLGGGSGGSTPAPTYNYGDAYTPSPTTSSGGGSGGSGGSGGTIPSGSAPTGNDSYTEPEKPDKPSFEDLFDKIDEQVYGVIGDINNQIGALPNLEGELIGNVGNNVTAQQGLVNNALTQGQSQLDTNSQEAKNTEKITLRTLADDVRNLFQSGNQMLGSMGASDSSASEMLKYALAKQGNRRTSDVVGQTRKILGDIQNMGVQLKSKANEELLKIDQWKSTQEMSIKTYIQGLKSALEAQKNNVNSAVAERNIALITEKYQYARQRYDQIQDQATNWKNSLAADFIQRSRDLSDYASKLALEAKYNGNYADSYGNIQGMNNNINRGQSGSNNQPSVFSGYGGYGDDEEDSTKNLLNSGSQYFPLIQ